MKKFVKKGKKMITLSILAMAVMCGTALAANIDAIVPASLPITVSADGSVVTATNASIQNYGSDPLLVSSINVAGQNGWSLAAKDTAATASIGDKIIAMAFNGQWSDTNGVVNVASFDKIAAKGSLPLKYDAKAPAAKTAESEEAATATFVVKDLSAPTMAAGSSWYKSTMNRNTITKITFMDSYTPSTEPDEKWFSDVENTGSITCYRTGTEIIIAGNGAGKIQANADSSYMFSSTGSYSFSKLISIENLSLLDTSNVTDMSWMFTYCSSLTSIDLSGFDTSSVTDMGVMFHQCTGLTSLDLSKFSTSNVTNMYHMFDYCIGLTSINLSGLDTSNVTDMSSMFTRCEGLSSLDLSGFNTANVTNMSFMFYYCTGLTSLDLSSFDTSNVTNMYEMFYKCNNLVTIYASDKWNTNKVTDSTEMFNNCTRLKGDIAFNSNYVDKTYAKIHNGYLTEKGESPVMAARDTWYKSSKVRDSITKITFMDSYTPASTVDETWFADVDNTGAITCYRTGTELIIAGNGTGKIMANPDSSYMFADSEDDENIFINLVEIDNLSLLDTSNVTNMNIMFFDCENLRSLDLSGFNTSNVTSMSGMFYWCGLVTLDLSGFDTSKVTNMNQMFYYCAALKTIYVSDEWDTDKVTDSYSMFFYCISLKGDIAYNSNYVDQTYAKAKGGYLTYKAASTKTLSLNIDHTSGAVTSYDVSTSPMSTYKEMIRAVAAA